jgi:hypothetical protein
MRKENRLLEVFERGIVKIELSLQCPVAHTAAALQHSGGLIE